MNATIKPWTIKPEGPLVHLVGAYKTITINTLRLKGIEQTDNIIKFTVQRARDGVLVDITVDGRDQAEEIYKLFDKEIDLVEKKRERMDFQKRTFTFEELCPPYDFQTAKDPLVTWKINPEARTVKVIFPKHKSADVNAIVRNLVELRKAKEDHFESIITNHRIYYSKTLQRFFQVIEELPSSVTLIGFTVFIEDAMTHAETWAMPKDVFTKDALPLKTKDEVKKVAIFDRYGYCTLEHYKDHSTPTQMRIPQEKLDSLGLEPVNMVTNQTI